MNDPLHWQATAIIVHICADIKNRGLSYRGGGKKEN